MRLDHPHVKYNNKLRLKTVALYIITSHDYFKSVVPSIVSTIKDGYLNKWLH